VLLWRFTAYSRIAGYFETTRSRWMLCAKSMKAQVIGLGESNTTAHHEVAMSFRLFTERELKRFHAPTLACNHFNF
jgi:hypothetical protein